MISESFFVNMILDAYYFVLYTERTRSMKDKFAAFLNTLKEKFGPLTLKKIIPVVLILVIVIVLIVVFASCNKDSGGKPLSEKEAATLVLDDGDEAWIAEYLAGDTGLSKNDHVEGVTNETALSAEGNVIDWEPVKDAIAYKVYRAESEDGKYECIATTTETSYTDKDTDGKKYVYKTTAVKKTATTAKATEGSKGGDGTTPATGSGSGGKTTTAPSGTGGKPSGGTTSPTGGSSHTSPNDGTTKPVTTTQAPTTTTTKPIASAPGYTPSNSQAKTARAAFEANARTAESTQALAQKCADSLGSKYGSVKAVSNGGIIALKSKSIDGFSECYQFTKKPALALWPATSVKCIGYVFKVNDGTDPAEFAARLQSGAISSYYSNAVTRVFSVKEKTTDYYDQYVFFMVTE